MSRLLLACALLALGACAADRPCTMEAKVCPDGSYVGRNPNNYCWFDPCP